MPVTPSRHRSISWLAIALLLFTSLSPMLKPSSETDGGWVEMCSGHGPATSPAPAAADGSASSETDDGWCKLHCSLLQLPGGNLTTSLARAGIQQPNPLPPLLPQPVRPWPGALSRAPPRSA